MKDLPDPTQQRMYSRRPTITSLSQENSSPGTRLKQNGATVTRTESIPEQESPRVTVEGLSAAWGGKVGDCTHWDDYCAERTQLVFRLTPAQSGKLTLKNISFECDMSNRMLAIVGPVGAGKVRLHTSLTHVPTAGTHS